MLVGKFKDKLINIFIVIFFLSFSWICINNIINHFEIVYKISKKMQIVCTIGYIIAVLCISRFIAPQIQKHRFFRIGIIVFVFLVSIGCAIYFRVDLKLDKDEGYTWDLGNFFSTAEGLAKGDYSGIDYLRRYPNNIMITVMFAGIIKVASFLGCKDMILCAVIINAFVVWLSIVLMYKNSDYIYGNKVSSMVLLIGMMTTPFYLYAPIFYSDTFSMFFIMLILYFIIKLNDENSTKKENFIRNIFLGIVVFIGFEIKLTSIFIVIAYGIYVIMQKNIKEHIKKFIIAVCVFCMMFCIYKYATNKYITNEEVSTRTPVYHWIMMGLKDEGNYNTDDYNYTDSYKTYDEKKNEDIKMIKERCNQYTVKTFIEHINKKLVFTWGDGTYYAPIKLERAPHRISRFHYYVLREYNKTTLYYKYIPQAMQYGMLIFIVASALFVLRSKEEKDSYTIIFYITMFGFMLFLLIWENRSRYIFNILPIMIILEARGIELLSNYKFKGKKMLLEKN